MRPPILPRGPAARASRAGAPPTPKSRAHEHRHFFAPAGDF
jgi:hypothetical protein